MTRPVDCRRAWLVAILAVASVAMADVKITHIQTSKLRYAPGETARFIVAIRNTEKTPFEGTLRLDVVSELDRLEPVGVHPVRLRPKSALQTEGAWRVPKPRKWSHEVRGCLVDTKGKQVARRREFFAVGEHAWQVGHWNALNSLGSSSIKDFGQLEREAIGILRRWYYTTVDYFSPQPSGWETLAPQQEVWLAGQNASPESKATLKWFIKRCHELGIEVFSYLKGSSWGPAGVEFVRAHPEWWNFDQFGTAFPSRCEYDVDKLEALRQGKKGWKRTFRCSTGVLWHPDMKTSFFDELRRSVEMFDWDGFRSDGLPRPGDAYDRTG